MNISRGKTSNQTSNREHLKTTTISFQENAWYVRTRYGIEGPFKSHKDAEVFFALSENADLIKTKHH